MTPDKLKTASVLNNNIASCKNILDWLNLVGQATGPGQKPRGVYQITANINTYVASSSSDDDGYLVTDVTHFHNIPIPTQALNEMKRHYTKLLQSYQDEFEKL